MLKQIDVDSEEEQLSARITELTDAQRKEFYATVKNKIKDPDTYAALNWFFITGLHHFYLGKWLSGMFDLILFIIGVTLIIIGLNSVGILLIVLISIVELWALFRAQIIVQDYNNRVYETALNEL